MGDTTREEQLRKLIIEARFGILETDVIDGQSLYSMRHIKDEIDKYFKRDEIKKLIKLLDVHFQSETTEAEKRAYKQGWDSAGGELVVTQEECDELITKAHEQLLDELEAELKPEGIVMQGNIMTYKCNIEQMLEAKRKEIKESKG